MPAKSKSQQRFFGMVDAYKKGELENASQEIKDAANGMTSKEVKKFAKTKHKGLPEKIDEKKKPSAQDQVHNKVNAACLDSIMVCENTDNIEIWYRGYNSKYGEQRDHLLWVTDDLDYAKEYGDTIMEYQIDSSKCDYGISDVEEVIGYFDYLDGPNEEDCEELLNNGVGCYCFMANDDESYCMCLWDSSCIISKRVISESINENVEWNEQFDYKPYLKSILEFLTEQGLNVKPYPKTVLHKEEQEGLYIKTGYYDPSDGSVHLFIKNRHPKDVLRSFCHEMIHKNQDIEGRIGDYKGQTLEGDDILQKMESEAYLKGNILFRKWTETLHPEYPQKDMINEVKRTTEEGKNVPEECSCGGKVELQIHGEPVWVCHDCGKYYGTLPFKNEGAEPESDKYVLGMENDSNLEYAHVNENTDNESVTVQADDDQYSEVLNFGINVNVDEQDWIDLIFDGEKTILTCGEKNYKQWQKHIGEMIGIVRTTRHHSKDNPSSMLVGYARLVGVKKYTDYNFVDDYINHRVPQGSINAVDRCGLVINDVHELSGEGIKMSKETRAVRPLYREGEAPINEDIEEIVNPEDVDLHSFNIKHNLNPKFWKNGKLNTDIKLKLLDIANDFIDFLGFADIEPVDIIMTGSLANYNWDDEYSDIDLHIVYNFAEIDENKEFVAKYFNAQKSLWNKEHEGIEIMGFPVEVYVQDSREPHASSGVYSLEYNRWIMTPEREELVASKVNKSFIKEKVSEYMNKIDKLCYLFKKATTPEKLKKIEILAKDLFDEIKSSRKKGFELSGGKEINNYNICFKALRRNGYLGKLVDLRTKTYNKLNSLS